MWTQCPNCNQFGSAFPRRGIINGEEKRFYECPHCHRYFERRINLKEATVSHTTDNTVPE